MAKKVTYIDKVDNNGLTPNGIVNAANMNEIKAAVNENADILDGKSFNEILIIPSDIPKPPPVDTSQDQIYVPSVAGTYVNFPTTEEPSGIIFNPDNGITKIYGNSVKGFRRIDYPIDLSGIESSLTQNYKISGGSVKWSRLSNGNWNLNVSGSPTLFFPGGGYAIIQPYNGTILSSSIFVYLSEDSEGLVPFNPNQNPSINGTQAFVQSSTRQNISGKINNANFPLIAFVNGYEVNSVDGFDDRMKNIKIQNWRIDYHLASKVDFKITETGSIVSIEVITQAVLFDPFGGFRFIDPQVINVPNQYVVYLSSTAGTYTAPSLSTRGTGQKLFFHSEMYNVKTWIKEEAFPIGMVWKNQWITGFDALRLSTEQQLTTDNIKELNNTLPRVSFGVSPLKTELYEFFSKMSTRRSDVTLVVIGDSKSTDFYASPMTDAAYRPPMMTDNSYVTKLESKLRWKEQQYRRFDSMTVQGGSTPVFTEILGGGTASNISDEPATWGWVDGANFYKSLTRCIDGGTDAGVTFSYPAGMRRCNFIYHTDFKWGTPTTVTVAQGNGLVEVWNGTAWIEANGYSFNARENEAAINPGVAGRGSYHKDVYQRRLKMRSLTNIALKTITIQNTGTGRFGYWGIEYSPKEFMFTCIRAARGGHNIAQLKVFEPWMVDEFSPDLVLYQSQIINEQAQTGVKSGSPITKSPITFAQTFSDYYTHLTGKGYLVFPFIDFIGIQAGIVNETTGEWGVGYWSGYGEVTIPDYIGHLDNAYMTLNAPYTNLFDDFLTIAERKATLEGTNNIYTSAIMGSSATGNTFTVADSVHFNDYGNEILYRLLGPYFNT